MSLEKEETTKRAERKEYMRNLWETKLRFTRKSNTPETNKEQYEKRRTRRIAEGWVPKKKRYVRGPNKVKASPEPMKKYDWDRTGTTEDIEDLGDCVD